MQVIYYIQDCGDWEVLGERVKGSCVLVRLIYHRRLSGFSTYYYQSQDTQHNVVDLA